MTQAERQVLYEKLYFHELERREKISARLALPFAAILAVVGLLSFLLNSESQLLGRLWMPFWSLFAASSIALLTGAWFFRRAWFGHEDKLLPTAHAIENYHAMLTDTYAEFENHNELVSEHFNAFIFEYYKRFSSENAITNDERSYNIYRANVALTAAVLLALATAVPYYIGRAAPGEHANGNVQNTAPAATAATAAQR